MQKAGYGRNGVPTGEPGMNFFGDLPTMACVPMWFMSTSLPIGPGEEKCVSSPLLERMGFPLSFIFTPVSSTRGCREAVKNGNIGCVQCWMMQAFMASSCPWLGTKNSRLFSGLLRWSTTPIPLSLPQPMSENNGICFCWGAASLRKGMILP